MWRRGGTHGAETWRRGGAQGAEKRETEESRTFLREPDMTPLHPPLLLLHLHLNRRPGWKGAETLSGKKTGINRTKRRDTTPHPPRLPLRKRRQGGRGVERGNAGLRETRPPGRRMKGTTGRTQGRDRRGRRLLANRKMTGEGTDACPMTPCPPPLAHLSPMGVKEKGRRRGEEKETGRVQRRGRGI